MNKVFIIGAGFSKAVANAPLANELFPMIYKKAMEQYEDRDETQVGATCFLDIAKMLQKSIEPMIGEITKDGTEIETYADIPNLHPINIEYLCTLIDLNLETPYVPKGKGIDLSSCALPFIENMIPQDLKHARNFIHSQIVELLLPDALRPDTTLLKKILSRVEEGDTVITFNYDLLIEQTLWKMGLWSPVDGYRVGAIKDDEEFDAKELKKTEVPVFKLHGSVNWLTPSWAHPELQIYTTHPYTNEPMFEGLQVRTRRPLPKWRRLEGSHVILPTFIKYSHYAWELQLVRKVIEALSNASEVYILGYSLPEADAMANILFTQIANEASIYIVNRDPDDLVKRLNEKFGHYKKKIVFEKNDIEAWVENDFEYKAYQRHLEGQRLINSLIRFESDQLIEPFDD